MAVHHIGSASALPLALAVIPSLPRPLLKRLVERAIDRLDEMDGDCDLEDGNDAETLTCSTVGAQWELAA